MNRNLFVSTACLPGAEPIVRRISEYHRNGMRAIELGAGVTADEEVADKLLALGGQFLVHNYFPPPRRPFVLNLASPDVAIRQRSIEFVVAALTLCARIGAPFYSIHAGFIADPVGFGDVSYIFPHPGSEQGVRDAERRFIGALKIPLEAAQRLGILLLIENNVCPPELRDKLLLQAAEEFLFLFQELPHPSLGILMDTGHLNVSANTLGFDRLAFIEKTSSYVRAVHVHDNNGQADTHMPISPDSWVLEALRGSTLADVPLVVEARFDSASSLRRHIDWLIKMLG